MGRASGRNFAFGVVNAYVIVVLNKHAPTDEEWREWVQAERARGAEDGVFSRYLTVTEGGTPTSAQRKQMLEAIQLVHQKNPTAIRLAIVTPSTFTRGFVEALRLTSPMFRAFSPDDMAGAYAYLGIPPAYFDKIEATIAALKTQLRP